MSHDAFLRRIQDAPGDDAPRLVYADWLDEQGDPASAARAEFIRLQVRAAGLPDFDPRKVGVEAKAEELLAANEVTWLGGWPDGLCDWTWERGFVAAVAVFGRELAAKGDAIFAAQPVTRLRVVPDPVPPESAGERPAPWPPFHDQEWLSRLEELDLRGDRVRWQWDRYLVPGVAVARFLAGQHLTRLRTLRLRHPEGLGPAPDSSGRDLAAHLLATAARETLTTLEVSDHSFDLGEGQRLGRSWGRFPELREVILTGCNFGSALLRGLVTGPARTRLARLGLGGTRAGRHTLADLFSGGPLPALRDLDLGGANLRPADLDAILDGPACPGLRVLRVAGQWYRDEFAEPSPAPQPFPAAVAGSAFWQRATGLFLRSHGIDAERLRPLSRSSRSAGLRELDLSSNPLGAAGVEELCGAAWLGRLTHLRLNGTELNREACATLAACMPLGCLRELDLGRNTLDGADITAFTKGSALKRVVSLNLSGAQPGCAGLDAILNSGTFPHLRELRLSMAGIGEEELRVIARSPHLKRLRRLDLSLNRTGLSWSAQALAEFAESPHLSGCLALDLAGQLLPDAPLAGLRRRLRGRLRV